MKNYKDVTIFENHQEIKENKYFTKRKDLQEKLIADGTLTILTKSREFILFGYYPEKSNQEISGIIGGKILGLEALNVVEEK